MALEWAQFQYASDQSLIVYLGQSINIETHHRVLKLLRLLEFSRFLGFATCIRLTAPS